MEVKKEYIKEIFNLADILSRKENIIFDSSCIESEGFKLFVQKYLKLISDNKEMFSVAEFEINKLEEKYAHNIELMINRNYINAIPIEVVADYNDLIAEFAKIRAYKPAIIVNSFDKRRELIAAGKTQGVFLKLYSISQDGDITSFDGKSNGFAKKENAEKAFHQSDRVVKEKLMDDKFFIKNRPELFNYENIRVSEMCKEGSLVHSIDGSQLKLVKKELENANSITYSTEVEGLWVKVFNPQAINTFLVGKIERMLSKKIEYPGLCWPKFIVYNSKNEFVGYAMNPVDGFPLHLSLFKQAGLQSNFPNWNRRDIADVTLTILNVIKYMHDKGILFGCINPAAIRIIDKNHVCFADTDNYQIEGFPCTVTNISFAAPEMLDKKLYFATKQSEDFAVATLVFMCMMLGKTPYASGDGNSGREASRQMRFPYFANGKIYGKDAMPSSWRFMWSHLANLKYPFQDTFRKGGKYNDPGARKSTAEWVQEIGKYKKILENPNDLESLKLYPETFYRAPDEAFYKCASCGIEHPKYYFDSKYFDNFRICNSCIDKKSNVSFTCKACKKTYYYTNRTALFHKTKKMEDADWKDQKYCPDCKKKTVACRRCGKIVPYFYTRDWNCQDCNEELRNEVYTTDRCKECGYTFEITMKDYQFYSLRGMNLPRTCKVCRDRKKKGFWG